MALQPFQGEKEATFKGVNDAVLRRIRGAELPAQQRISQMVKASGLRTSGVGQIPGLSQERSRGVREAGAIAQLGSQRLGQLGQQEAIAQQGAINERLARFRASVDQDIAKTRGREALQSALIGGIGGFATGGFGGAAFNAFNKKKGT